MLQIKRKRYPIARRINGRKTIIYVLGQKLM